jgi:hypothetical protein
MIAIAILVLAVTAIVASLVFGQDSRVLDDERGWWPGYRRDRAER